MNWPDEAYREVEEAVQRMIADLPRPPRLWREQKAITDYIMQVMDISDYMRFHLDTIDHADDDHPPTRFDKEFSEALKLTLTQTPEDREARKREAIDEAIEDFRAGRYRPLFDAFRYGELRYGMSKYPEALELIIAKARVLSNRREKRAGRCQGRYGNGSRPPSCQRPKTCSAPYAAYSAISFRNRMARIFVTGHSPSPSAASIRCLETINRCLT